MRSRLFFPNNTDIAANHFHADMKRIILSSLWAALCLQAGAQPAGQASAQPLPEPVRWVNPFIGTGGHGHTFPGATLPFGMVQLSPDTRLDGWDGCSGYHYTDSIVYGFSHTHLSGTGVSDYGDVLLMPTTGSLQLDNGARTGYRNGYASPFDKSKETASPGYYSTYLTEYQTKVELTATERAGFHRYTFDNATTANVVLDLLHRDLLTGDTLIFDRLDEGEISGHRISRAWAEEQHLYFVIRFSRPGRIAAKEERDGKAVKLGLQFTLDKDRILLAKVGISGVSITNARKNLLAEIPHWNFEQTRYAAQNSWMKELGKVTVRGGTDEQRINFYTALYHSMIAPNLWSDINGHYRGMDGQVHRAEPGRKVYTVFSLWDTFRANHPLFTILQQERTQDFIYTFLQHYQQGGRLPVWELAANETECMIGYHSVSVVADAYAKGLRNWDQQRMLQAMVHGANLDHFGLGSYKKHGCVLAADEAESVSKTLEYAYDDWCIANFAAALGQDSLAALFMERAQYYKNLYDPHSGFFRARVDGNWFTPFDPAEVNFNYTEANAWQYGFFVPHDLAGLTRLLGGPQALDKKLDALFAASSQTTGRQQADITGLIGQYAHGNEPSHHVAYLYNFAGKPWKAQKMLRRIMAEMYHNKPDGLSGNEDCGQMSAWYVFSAMGMYPVTPGLPLYSLGSPIFDEVEIRLENGNTLFIKAPQGSEGEQPYVQAVSFNGLPIEHSYVEHSRLMAGGELAFVLGKNANMTWAAAPELSAITRIDSSQFITPTPAILAGSVTFTDKLEISITAACSDCRYQYRLSDDAPVLDYQGPFSIDTSRRLTAWALSAEGRKSREIQQDFHKIRGGRSVRLESTYANQYSAGGEIALIDYLRGSGNFRTGRWQGYEGQRFVAVVDFGELVSPDTVGVGFLQDVGSWIFLPPKVTFSVSTDGKNYARLGTVTHSLSDTDKAAVTHDFVQPAATDFRYLKVEAENYGPCPAWHPGAGGNSWLFVDEIWAR